VRELDWASGARNVLAVESEGAAEVPDGSGVRSVRFRVDRFEPGDSAGAFVLTDYKSGKPLTEAKKAATRDKDLARHVAEGRTLQLAAYALARLEGGQRLVGRLLFARPDLEDAHREVLAEATTLALAGAPWEAIFRARDLGAFPPRLVGSDLRTTFEGCKQCEVRIACVQGDSGARLRFERWAAGGAEAPPDRTDAERAARVLFELHPPRRAGNATPGEDPGNANGGEA
jgi:hypothetical protein